MGAAATSAVVTGIVWIIALMGVCGLPRARIGRGRSRNVNQQPEPYSRPSARTRLSGSGDADHAGGGIPSASGSCPSRRFRPSSDGGSGRYHRGDAGSSGPMAGAGEEVTVSWAVRSSAQHRRLCHGAVMLVIAGLLFFRGGKFFKETLTYVLFFDGSAQGLTWGRR